LHATSVGNARFPAKNAGSRRQRAAPQLASILLKNPDSGPHDQAGIPIYS